MIQLLLFSIFAAAALIVAVHLSPRKEIVFPVAAIYAAALFYFVCVRGARSGLGGVNTTFPFPFWTAFVDIHYGLTTNRSMLNLILFIPFGYLLPKLYNVITWLPRPAVNGKSVRVLASGSREMSGWTVVLLGFAASFSVELSQFLFRFGVFEPDDLIKNTLGAAVGFYIYCKLAY
jgi:glycopeptide antibiotics resistance protein